MLGALIFLAVCFLAYSNGANDNFKGVASLFGSRTCGYRTAISWATVATFAGSVAALFLAQTLLKKFSGKGLVPDALIASPQFVLAVAFGAGATVILATLLGFPISTTHGLTGALVGAGLVAASGGVNFAVLGKAFVMDAAGGKSLAVITFILRLAVRAEVLEIDTPFRPPHRLAGLLVKGHYKLMITAVEIQVDSAAVQNWGGSCAAKVVAFNITAFPKHFARFGIQASRTSGSKGNKNSSFLNRGCGRRMTVELMDELRLRDIE